MTQETVTEIDMDVFSRRMSPYLSWLESKIESGWQQSETINKDVLKEVKQLSTTMRARFILGVGKSEFAAEVKRIVDIFVLAEEAFPDFSDEVDAKTRHFMKGIGTELGDEFLPKDVVISEPALEVEKPVEVAKPVIEKVKPEVSAPITKPKIKVAKKSVKKVAKPKSEVKVSKVKVEPKEAKVKVDVKPEPIKESKVKPEVKAKVEVKPAKSKPKKPNFIVRWFKGLIFGDD